MVFSVLARATPSQETMQGRAMPAKRLSPITVLVVTVVVAMLGIGIYILSGRWTQPRRVASFPSEQRADDPADVAANSPGRPMASGKAEARSAPLPVEDHGIDAGALDARPPGDRESPVASLLRMNLTAHADEAVFRLLNMPERVRSNIRMINLTERRRWSLAGFAAGTDPEADRQAALEDLLGLDRLEEFQSAETAERSRLATQRKERRLHPADAGIGQGPPTLSADPHEAGAREP